MKALFGIVFCALYVGLFLFGVDVTYRALEQESDKVAIEGIAAVLAAVSYASKSFAEIKHEQEDNRKKGRDAGNRLWIFIKHFNPVL